VQRDSEFNPIISAKKLLREARGAALATLTIEGKAPYASLVNVATAADGSPLLLISQLALHTRYIAADQRVSLLLTERSEGDPLRSTRLTLMGTAAATTDENDKRRFLSRHVEAGSYAGFKDFTFHRVTLANAHLVAGFGRIVDLSAGDLVTEVAGAQALLDAEADICAHMNEGHLDAVRLLAQTVRCDGDAEWRCVGCDPEGLELQDGDRALRVAFPRTVRAPGELRQMLKLMLDQPRGTV